MKDSPGQKEKWKREKLEKKFCFSERIRNIMERIPRPETLVRRRSQRVSNGSNFEADFKMLQDSDDDCVVSNDSGMKKIRIFSL